MGKNAFPYAIYKDNDKQQIITPQDIDPAKSYKEKLFCPNENCGARLEVVHGKNGYFFRGIDIKQHVEGCEYYHEYPKYDTEEKFKKSYTEGSVVTALKRKLKELTKGGAAIYRPPVAKGPVLSKSKRQGGTVVSYKAEQIDDSFLSRAIAVYGSVESIHIVDKDPEIIHAYINFKIPNLQKVSVIFSHNQYQKDASTKEFVEKLKEQMRTIPKGKANCICFGWVWPKEENKGYNITPFSLSAIHLYE